MGRLLLGNNESLQAVLALIKGSLPDANYDEIEKKIDSSELHTYSFFYRGALEFQIAVTDPYGNYNASFVDYSLFVLEDGSGWLLNEDGTNILL